MIENRKIFTMVLLTFLVFSLITGIFKFPLQVREVKATFGIARVQGKSGGGNIMGPGYRTSLPSGPKSGDIIIGTFDMWDNTQPSMYNITETNVNWTRIVSQNSSFIGYMDSEIWIGIVGTSASASIYLDFHDAPVMSYDIYEYSGVATLDYLDKNATNQGFGTGTDTGTTVATSQPNELWIGTVALFQYTQSNATKGFTLLDGSLRGTGGYYVSNAYLEQIVSSTGTANSGTTGDKAGYWVGCIATFKAGRALNILSPQNTSYNVTPVQLTFTLNESTSWMGYSLDNQSNVTLSGNTTLTGLSVGQHSIILYANDTSGNMGSSDAVIFTVVQPRTIMVPDDYPTIQQAINAVSDGDTVFVRNGTYYENVVVNKTLTLISEQIDSTTIDGSNKGDVIRIEANNVSVYDFTLQDTSAGWCGVAVESGFSNATITNNRMIDNRYGAYFENSSNNNVSGNNITTNNNIGILLDSSSNNYIGGNNITNNYDAILLEDYSSLNSISGNNITGNSWDGIEFYSSCNHNSISGNNIANNSHDGIELNSSFANEIYHNNFNNTSQVLCDGSPNVWDDSYPSGGNFWSDYNSTDFYSGVYQNESGRDGIGDVPYSIDSNNVDSYPLMNPWPPFEGTTYIREDGSVDPSRAPVLRKGDLYILTGNIASSAAGIVIERDNVMLDGAGYALQGEDEYTTGIDLYGRTNVTVQNLRIEAFGYGILLGYCSNNTISGNNVANCFLGIGMGSSVNNTVSENNITSNVSGMRIDSANNNTISGNKITANTGDGLELCASSNNKLTDNAIADNWDNFIVSESSSEGVLSDFVNDIDTSNTVDGKPVYYWIDRSNMTVPSDAGYVALVDCTNIRAQDLNLTRNGQSLLLAYSTNSVLTENNIGNVALYFSSDNTISENDIKPTSYEGIYLHGSSNNNISENNITTYGSYDYGVSLEYCSKNTISGNNVINCYLGILVLESSNNMFYHNNFINNSQQVQAYNSLNAWDNGYPSGGNYWSDYNERDLYCGPYQNVTGSDGIDDTPYVIDGSNQDNCPLMKPYPWAAYDVGVTYVATSKSVVGGGFSMSVNVMMFNYGNDTETFNVTIYANQTVISETYDIVLTSRNFTIFSLTWNTTGFALGNYTISAYAWPVSGETDTADNNFTGCWVMVAGIGDLTGGTTNPWDFVPDGKVLIGDVAVVAKFFGKNVPPAPVNCDVSGPTIGVPDGKILIDDVALVAKHFGQHYSYP